MEECIAAFLGHDEEAIIKTLQILDPVVSVKTINFPTKQHHEKWLRFPKFPHYHNDEGVFEYSHVQTYIAVKHFQIFNAQT